MKRRRELMFMQLLYLWIRTLQVAEENNIPVDKFCFVMAKSFINDVDANKYKVEKYFTETI